MVRPGSWLRIALVSTVVFTSWVVSAQPAPDPQPAPSDPQPAPVEPAPAPAPTTAPAPAPAPTTQPSQPSSYSAMAAQSGPAPSGGAGSFEERLEQQSVIPIISAGLVLTGGGETEFECDASGGVSCVGQQLTGNDYDDKSTFLVAGDLLFKISPRFRLGLGLMWIPTPSFEFDRAPDETDSGHEIDATVVGEWIFPVADTIGIYARGQIGVAALIVGNDHEDEIDNLKDICTLAATPDVNCDFSKGPFFGPTLSLGGGVGVLLGDAVVLRAGIVFQAYSLPYLNYKISGGGSSLEQTGEAKGNRGMLLVGAEF